MLNTVMEVAACDGPPGAEGTKDQRRASLSMGQRGQGMKRTTELGLMDGGRQVALQSLYLILSFSDHDLFFLERKPPCCWSQGPRDDDDTTTEWKATGRFVDSSSTLSTEEEQRLATKLLVKFMALKTLVSACLTNNSCISFRLMTKTTEVTATVMT